jgi:hypothetical protein
MTTSNAIGDPWAMAQGSDGTFYEGAYGTGSGTIFAMNIA